MRQVLLILFFLISINSSGQTKFSNKHEREIYNCIVENYKNIGIDIIYELDKFEQALISNNILADNTCASYIEIYGKMATDNDFSIDSLYNNDALNPNKSNQQTCYSSLIDKLPKKSKIKQLRIRFQDIMPTGNISMPTVANTILETLDCKDFNNPLIRLYSLQSIYLISRFNPPTNKKITTCLDCYNITIKTTAIQTIILNENIVDIEEFSLKLNDIINKSGVNNRDKFQYILDIHPDTKMGLISKLVKIMRDSKIKSMIYNSN